MYLNIQKLSPEVIASSQKYFGEDFCIALKKEKSGTYYESLVARYLLSVFSTNKSFRSTNRKVIYNSISHKNGLVFIGCAVSNIGVDIEIIKKRDKSVLSVFRSEEYSLVGGENWRNFYVLWTAKEAFIKYKGLILDDMKDIRLSYIKNKSIIFSNIDFHKTFVLRYKGKDFRGISGLNIAESMVYSVCY